MVGTIDRLKRQRTRFLLARNPQKTKEWLVGQIQKLKANRPELLRDKSRASTTAMIGEMCFFSYDPKTKATLPYYDRFPLIFPIDYYDNGFLGINLHYLPPNQRALLIDKLMETATNKNFDETTKLKISYSVLASTKKFKAFEPCLKRYLTDHMRSKFVRIEADSWDLAIFLPVANFSGASQNKVWKESMDRI